MTRGRVKKLFPGGNTCEGFYSYYHFMIQPDATRIIILKGGPGVGKSSFMRWIGEQMQDLGYDVEFHCCSSDNGSLDGLVIPAIKVALLDGTAPHVVDPKNPGAVDEILHLGDYWNESQLRSYKNKILQVNSRVGKLFKIAYFQLAEAKVIKDELDSYYAEAMNQAPVNGIIHNIGKSLFSNSCIQFKTSPQQRHLFATAFTPQGQIHYLDTILQDVENLYLITSEATDICGQIVNNVAATASMHGLDTEVYHSALEPQKTDLVVIPALKLAILKDLKGLNFKPQDVPSIGNIKVFNLDQFLNPITMELYEKEIKCCNERIHSSVCRAIHYIAAAKAEHDRMEKYYIPAMDFKAITAKRNAVLQRILEYAEELK